MLSYTVVLHSSRRHAIVASLNGGPRFVARFAPDESGEWTQTGVTWLGQAPPLEQRHPTLEGARRALLKELGRAGVVVRA